MAIAEGPGAKQKDLPKLLVSREVLKKWKGEIKAETYTLLQKYQAFHQKVVGVKPDESELVDKALLAAFQSCDAFQKFVNNGGGKTVATSDTSGGGKGGGSGDLSQS